MAADSLHGLLMELFMGFQALSTLTASPPTSEELMQYDRALACLLGFSHSLSLLDCHTEL